MDFRPLLLLFLGLALASFASGSSMLIYGVVDLPEGAGITAVVVDSVVGNCSVGKDGSYSILVEADRGGDPVEFYSGGARAKQVVDFTPYSFMGVDLDFVALPTTSTTTTTTSSTTLPAPPEVTGYAVSVSISDNAMNLGIVVLLVVIAYSMRDIFYPR